MSSPQSPAQPIHAHSPADTVTLKSFAGAVAHELNNVLTAIGGNLSILNESEEAGIAEIAASLEAAIRSLSNGERLSEKLEAVAGRLALRRSVQDVNTLLAAALAALPVSSLEKVEIKLDLSPDAPVAVTDGEKLAAAVRGLVATATRALAGADARLAIKSDRVDMPDQRAPSLTRGRYACISVICSGADGAIRAFLEAFSNPYARDKILRHPEWCPASIAGFVSQNSGEIVLNPVANRSVSIDLFLPSEDVATPNR